MNLSQKGLDIIKKYEGLRLTAYKPVSTEKYWTIGYGHYGADVKEGMTITEAQAETYLKADCASAVKAVNSLGKNFTQNQFDALVSFTYNCGAGNLKSLCKNRTIEEIGEKIPLYNKAGGKVLKGLVRRRAEEQALYQSGGNPYPVPTRNLKRTSPMMSGNDVKWLQYELNITVDGKFGDDTKRAVLAYQKSKGLLQDGIVGAKTRASMLKD